MCTYMCVYMEIRGKPVGVGSKCYLSHTHPTLHSLRLPTMTFIDLCS